MSKFLLESFFLLLSLSSVTTQLTADIFLTNPSNNNNNQLLNHQHKPSSALSTPELNAILSLRLNISHFESLPTSLYPNTPNAQILFPNPHSELPLDRKPISDHPKLLLVLYGARGQDLLPAQTIDNSQWFSLPNPPDILSFDALFSVFIGRIVETTKRPITSIYGVKDFITGYHEGLGLRLVDNIREWASDWTDSLAEWIQWANTLAIDSSELNSVNDDLQNNLDQKYVHLLKDYGPLDYAANELIEDMKKLENFKSLMAGTDQEGSPKISFIRLSSLQEIQRCHGETSRQYRAGVTGLKAVISNVLLDRSIAKIEQIILAVPAQPAHARLGKRTTLSILSPFKTSEQSFIKRDLLDRRRSVFGSAPIPIIPSSRKCFSTKAECETDSESCNSHGSCIEGQKTSGGKCFVCVCQKSRDPKTGKVNHWSGDRCQKQDLSSGFVLLAGSAFGLVVLFWAAVRLLMSVGSQPLPQQLASVSGSSKKLD